MSKRDYQEKIIFWLDWSTRHLKNFQRQNPPSEENHFEAIHKFGTMKVCCDLLEINVLEWCKAVGIPYKRRDSDYMHLFKAKEPFDILGKPMLKAGHYNDLIIKMIGMEVMQN